MQNRHVTGLILLFVAFGTPITRAQAPEQPESPGQPLRVQVNLVDIGVTVTDSKGRFVTGLDREDFEVFDNGVKQPIAGFVSSEDPAHLVLLIEDGTPDYLLAKFGLSPFAIGDVLLGQVSPSDRVAVVVYSKAPRLAFDFAPEALPSRYALRGLNSQLLHSHVLQGQLNLSFSLEATLDWLSSVPGSKTILLLSSGIDTSPPSSQQAVQEKLGVSDVRILAVSIFGGLGKIMKPKRGLSFDDREEQLYVKRGIANANAWLDRLSKATGGSTYFPETARDFDRDAAEIAPPISDG